MKNKEKYKDEIIEAFAKGSRREFVLKYIYKPDECDMMECTKGCENFINEWLEKEEYAQETASLEETISKKTYDFVKWERDIAISQLESYGVQLGEKADVEKIVRCKDCQYSRKYSNTLRSIYCSMLERTMGKDCFCSFGEVAVL